jgi:hypothetical protein
MIQWVLIFASQFVLANSPQVVCNYETVQEFCKKIENTEKQQLKSKSPFKFSGGGQMITRDSIENERFVLNERQAENKPLLEWSEQSKFNKAFDKVKKYARDSILQGREESELSEEEKNMLMRVQTMRVSSLNNPSDRQVCFDGARFGYSPMSHSLVMCPIMAGYSESALVWSMSAFVGRSLSTCPLALSDYNMKMNGKTTHMPPVPREKNPFQQFCSTEGCRSGGGLLKCLKEGGFPDNEDFDLESVEAKKVIDRALNHFAQSPKNKMNPLPVLAGKKEDITSNPENQKAIRDYLRTHRSCYPTITNSRIDSGIQDWFGADVAARYLKDHPIDAKVPEDNLEPLAALIDYNCRFPNSEEVTREFHADIKTRFNSAIFTNPALRKALNCQEGPSIRRNCSHSVTHKVKKLNETESGVPTDSPDGVR